MLNNFMLVGKFKELKEWKKGDIRIIVETEETEDKKFSLEIKVEGRLIPEAKEMKEGYLVGIKGKIEEGHHLKAEKITYIGRK